MPTDDDMFSEFINSCEDSLLYSETLTDNTRVAVVLLTYHVALYVNPASYGGSFEYEHRYCYCNLDAAMAAISLFKAIEQWLLWQKDHCNQVSVVDGYLYPQGTLHIPQNAIGMAGWNEKAVRAGNYQAYFFEHGPSKDRVWVNCSDGSTVGRCL